MTRLDELETLLQSLQTLKAPGASKSKIAAITTICVDNVQLDSLIAQKLYSSFKKSLPTHKLGVLFVVDSVTRQWTEKAKQAGQTTQGTSAPNGTWASGVQRLTELTPALIDDFVRNAPEDQKPRVVNLVDIWERGNTFPPKMLLEFKQKLQGVSKTNPASYTPPGSPPSQLLAKLVPTSVNGPSTLPTQRVVPPPTMPAMLAGHANRPASLLPPMVTPPPPTMAASMFPPPNIAAILAGSNLVSASPSLLPPTPYLQSNQSPMPQQAFAMPPIAPPPAVVPPQLSALFPNGPPAPKSGAAQPPQDAIAALATLLPPQILGNPEQLTKALQLFSELAKANIPQDQWGTVLAAVFPQPSMPMTNPLPSPSNRSWQPPSDQQHHSNTPVRRDRSRSPDFKQRDHYQNGGYSNSRNSPDRYRQRSPIVDDHSSYRQTTESMNNNKPKWITYDRSVPPGNIKVLSRTLFVGGCSVSEAELRAILSRFGKVQTCITNTEKRHAFVKLSSRADAVAVKKGMDELVQVDTTTAAKARQTKWGVGFGPRECCDYTTGESIIPIASLTEADLKWCLTAEHGGTGGKELEGGMVMEEPDIEIGAGVSSKAISKRVGTDRASGRNGRTGGGQQNNNTQNGRSKRGDDGYSNNRQGDYQQHQYSSANTSQRPQSPQVQEQSTFQLPAPVPTFGYSFAVPGSGR